MACFGQRNGSAAKAALGAYPADIPVRTAATGALILGVRAVDDVVPTLRQTGSEIRRGPLIDENVRHSCRSTFSRGPAVLEAKSKKQCLRSDYQAGLRLLYAHRRRCPELQPQTRSR